MTFSILLNIVGQDLVEFQNLPLLSEAEGHKKVVPLSNQALPSNMGRWLLGFSVLSAALLATTFAYQETKRSTARDAWRMEDNQEERRKEVKGDNPSNENQENSVMHNVFINIHSFGRSSLLHLPLLFFFQINRELRMIKLFNLAQTFRTYYIHIELHSY